MLDGPFGNLAATQTFLEALIQVPLTDFEVLSGGLHCQTLAFRAQEHALVLKISRNGTVLFAEQSIREFFDSSAPVPIPAVFFKGDQQGWAWIVQARCQGLALSQHLTVPRLQQAAQAALALHQWPATSIDATQWTDFLTHLNGFLPEEIRPHTLLTRSVWLDYREQMNDLSVVYRETVLGTKTAPVFCWIHGDLKPEHLFVNETVTGLIDWEMFRLGDFVYDWAVFLLYASASFDHRTQGVVTVQAILACFIEAYEGKGFELKHLNVRLKISALHSALGALFMYSQTQQNQRYQALKLRLDSLLQTDFEILV